MTTNTYPSTFLLKKKKNSQKIKIDFSDQGGTKYSFTIEGSSKEGMAKIMDFIENVSQASTNNSDNIQEQDSIPIDTNFARVYGLIETKFKFGSFTSSDVLQAYQEEYDIITTLSTISTYLSRLAERDLLTRSRNGIGWSYKLVREDKEIQQKEYAELPKI